MERGFESWVDHGSIRSSCVSVRSDGAGDQSGERRGAGGGEVGAVKLGLHPETLRKWVVDADVDARRRPAPPAADRERINKLERENRELRRTTF